MFSDLKFNLLSYLCASLWLVAACAVCSGEESSEQEDIDIPIPLNQPVKGIKVPSYDDKGRMTLHLEAAEARKIDEAHIEMDDLVVQILDNPERPFEVRMEKSVFDLDTRMLKSDTEVTIDGKDFNIVGDTAEFDTRTRFSRIIGDVKMTIINTDQYAQ